MVQSRKRNGNAESETVRSLQDHELDRVSGGVADLPTNLLTILDQGHQLPTGQPRTIGCPLGRSQPSLTGNSTVDAI
jgi:hypothetical protein